MAVMETEATDYEETDEEFLVYTEPKSLMSVKQALEAAGLNVTNAEQKYEPSQTIEITDEKVASQIIRLMNALEDLDDVSDVVSNFDINEELLAALSA
jgi:transcriptional/translational regulatory protein YebC/TACO1